MGRPPSSRSASFSLTAIVQCNSRYEYNQRQYLDCEDFSIDYIQNEVPIRQSVEKIILKEQENFLTFLVSKSQ